MVEIKMQINDSLARRLEPMYDWLPTVLELSLAGFKTPAAQTVSEIIDFLAAGPSPADVIAYHVSDRPRAAAPAAGHQRRWIGLGRRTG